MFREHVRSRDQAVNEKRAKQDGHAGTARYAEGDGRDEMAALSSVGRALSCNDAAHVAVAEGLSCTFLGPQSVAIGDPIDDRYTYSRDRAHSRPDPRTTQDQEPVRQTILDTEQHAGLGVDRHAFFDHGHSSAREVAELGKRENAER